jgi:hypothetical protein
MTQTAAVKIAVMSILSVSRKISFSFHQVYLQVWNFEFWSLEIICYLVLVICYLTLSG